MYNNYSGRMRHVVGVYSEDLTPGPDGRPVGKVLEFNARCDVQVKRGDQLSQGGAEVTRQFITILMRYTPRLTYDQWIKWKDREYQIQHISPDGHERDMMVTAEWVGK